MGSPVSPYFDGRSHRRRDSRNAGHLAGWSFLRNGSRHGGRFGHLGLYASIRDQPPAELVEDRIHRPDGFVRLRMSFCCVGSPDSHSQRTSEPLKWDGLARFVWAPPAKAGVVQVESRGRTVFELHVLGTSSARFAHGRSVSGSVLNTPEAWRSSTVARACKSESSITIVLSNPVVRSTVLVYREHASYS